MMILVKIHHDDMKLTLALLRGTWKEKFHSFSISLLSIDQMTSIVIAKVTTMSPSMAEPRTADLATDMMMMVCPGWWFLMTGVKTVLDTIDIYSATRRAPAARTVPPPSY